MAGSSGRLAGKVALVTGATSGIGEAIAREFLVEGATVMVHGLDQGAGAGVLERLNATGPDGDVGFVWGDLVDPEVCEKVVSVTVERFARLDILVNNAAAITRGDLLETGPDLFDYTMAVNARAPMLLARAAIPQFARSSGGAILNIGSVNAYCGERRQVAYAMSKGALMTLSRNLADAYASERIRVNHFNVGWVLTPAEERLQVSLGLADDWPARVPREFAPTGGLLTPEAVARFAVAFVEDGTVAVSGAVVELEQYPIIGRNPAKTVDRMATM